MIRILKSFFIRTSLANLLCMLDSCVSLFLEIVFSHKIVGVAAFLLQTSVILPRGCQSARSDDLFYG